MDLQGRLREVRKFKDGEELKGTQEITFLISSAVCLFVSSRMFRTLLYFLSEKVLTLT